MENQAPFLALTADIIAAYVGNNNIAISSVPSLIQDVYGALPGCVQQRMLHRRSR